MSNIITVAGGSGFVGRHVVRALADKGYTVNVLCRDTIAAQHLKTAGNVGQIVIQHADITKPETLKGKLDGSRAVVNLVSTLVSRGKQNFKALNTQGAARLAVEAKLQGATSFVQISGLGVDRATDTQYGQTKLQGENEVKAAFPAATILRPSLIFGVGDGFFEKFGKMSNRSPFLPVIGEGQTKFQPVYVEDVAQAVVNAIELPAAHGKTYELAGPQTFTFVQLLELILATTGRKRMLVRIPGPIAGMMGSLGSLLPNPPITVDQVKMLKHDSVAKQNGLEALGVMPTTLESQLPLILQRYMPR